MNRLSCALAMVVLFCVAAQPALAKGNEAYPNGAEDIFAGAVPPPGFYVLDYNYYYSADEYKDAPPGLRDEDFDLDIYANVLRLLYVSDKQILGGNWAMHTFIAYLTLDAEFDPPGIDFLEEESDDLGFIIVDPFILAYHWEHFHCVFAVDVYIPTADWNKDEAFNIGRNNYTIEPIFAWTYMWDSGWSLSQKLMWDFNTSNNDFVVPDPTTGDLVEGTLEPGEEFHFDYSLDYGLTPTLRAGVAGYAYWQVNDNRFNDVEVDEPKSRVFGIGPVVSATFFQGRLTLSAKVLPEFGARNHPEGIASWVKLIYKF